MKIHLWKLNSSISSACISSITLSAASIKLMFLFFRLSFELNIWIRIDIRPGQMDLNILFREVWESRMNRMRIQNNIKIKRAGEEFYYFITSFRNKSTVASLPSYLSMLPE